MSPTTDDLREDIKFLAGIDTRHRFLTRGSPEWFDRQGLIILVERDRDETPLVGVMLKYPSVCPADETATLEIKYWVANLKRLAALRAAFKANIEAINTKMAELGVERVWGLVPKDADHLTVRLNPIAMAAKCTRIDGATVRGDEDYSRGVFFFGNRADVNDWIQVNG